MELDDFFTTLNWTTLTLLCSLLVSLWWYEPWRNNPPGPLSLPLVGSLPFLPDRNFRRAVLKMRKKYGDVIKIDIGPRRIIVLCGYDLIKEALVNQCDVFSSRPIDYVEDRISERQGVIGNMERANQQLQRRFTLHLLRNYGFGKSTMETIILDEADQLVSQLGQHLHVEYSPSLLFKKVSSNVINMLAFGQRHAYDDPEFIKSMHLVDRLFEMIGPGSILLILPVLRFLPGDLFGYKEFNSVIGQLNANYTSWITNHKEAMAEGEEPSDLIGQYLVEIAKHKDEANPAFTEGHLMHIIGDLFLAGTDTSSATMNWIVLYLVTYPDMQEQVYREIVEAIGTERRPSTTDRPNLHYTECFIAETMRLSSVAPFALPHCTSEATTLNGYYIAKGSFIAVCTHSADMDPNIWEDPEKFNPDRFLNSEGKYQRRDESMLFSVGKRSCLGEGLARNEIFLFTISILQRYRLKLPQGSPTPSTVGKQGGIHNTKPYNVILEQRD